MEYSWIVAISIVVIGILFSTNKKKPPKFPPIVPGVPILGNALDFKKNAPQFLLKSKEKYGGVFMINLAGFKCVVVADSKAIGQIHMTPETVLSSYDGIIDFGFRDVLGPENVFHGATMHKNTLKTHFQNLDTVMHSFVNEIVKAFALEVPDKSGVLDLFTVTRKIILRASICFFIDEEVIKRYPNFVEEFHHFQEELEESVAKSSVLPRYISQFWSKKVEKERFRLIKLLIPIIEECMQQYEKSLKQSSYLCKLIEVSKAHELEHQGPKVTSNLIGEYCIGILFAGHKNPAIGSAQVVLMLLENPTHLKRVKEELASVITKKEDITSLNFATLSKFTHLEACVKETLRMTAHNIGSVRKVKGDFELSTEKNTYVIPEGYYLMNSHITMGLDPNVWSNSLQYDPERFYRKEDSAPHAWIPFSGGFHMCPGRVLAVNLLKAYAVIMFSLLDVQAEGKIPEMDYEKATLSQRKGPAKLRYSYRY